MRLAFSLLSTNRHSLVVETDQVLQSLGHDLSIFKNDWKPVREVLDPAIWLEASVPNANLQFAEEPHMLHSTNNLTRVAAKLLMKLLADGTGISKIDLKPYQLIIGFSRAVPLDEIKALILKSLDEIGEAYSVTVDTTVPIPPSGAGSDESSDAGGNDADDAAEAPPDHRGTRGLFGR